RTGRRVWPWVTALAVLVPLVLWLGAVLVRLETPEGTLVVRIDDPDVVVSVHDDGKAVVQEKSTKRTFSLKLEKGEIHVFDKDGDRLLVTRQFQLRKGERTTVEVRPEELAAARAAGSATAVLTSPDWEWTTPESLGLVVNSPTVDAAPTLSGDGLSLVF